MGHKEFMLQKYFFLKGEFGNLDDNCLPLIYSVMVEITLCPPAFLLLFLITHSQLLLGT